YARREMGGQSQPGALVQIDRRAASGEGGARQDRGDQIKPREFLVSSAPEVHPYGALHKRLEALHSETIEQTTTNTQSTANRRGFSCLRRSGLCLQRQTVPLTEWEIAGSRDGGSRL